MSGDVFHALEKFWDTLYSQGRAPKRVEKAHFLNFEVTFLEIQTCRTKMESVVQNYSEMLYLGQFANNKLFFIFLTSIR